MVKQIKALEERVNDIKRQTGEILLEMADAIYRQENQIEKLQAQVELLKGRERLH